MIDNIEAKSIVKTSIMMVILTAVSKILGFGREILLAKYYGSSFVIDAYSIAQSIPNILFGGILASLSTGFIPVLSNVFSKGSEEADRFTSKLLNIGFIVSFAVFIFCQFCSNFLVRVFAGGFSELKKPTG